MCLFPPRYILETLTWDQQNFKSGTIQSNQMEPLPTTLVTTSNVGYGDDEVGAVAPGVSVADGSERQMTSGTQGLGGPALFSGSLDSMPDFL